MSEPVTLRRLVLYFLGLGTFGFGGPVALAGAMERDLVERHGWFTPEDYRRGLTLAQLAPGPLAAQLAMYLGWVQGGVAGATAVSLAFVVPSFVMVLGLAAIYVRYGGIGWIEGAFYGVASSVIAIMLRSATRLAFRTVKRDLLLWAILVANAIATAIFETEYVLLILACGFLVLARSRLALRSEGVAAVLLPSFLLEGMHGRASSETLWKLAWYFTEAGAFVFGSGLAIVPFLHSGVVEKFGWLNEHQFLDAVAVAMITPGPVVITVAFIGYLVAGLTGAIIAAVAVFLPAYLFVILPARHYNRVANNTMLRSFVDGATAAAVGAIAGAVVVLGRRGITDIPTTLIFLVSLAILLLWKRIPEPAVVAAAALVGIMVRS
jgi:chromate transporter